MADIHVLKGSFRPEEGGVLHGSFPVAFHVTIASPDPAADFPGFVSRVPNLGAAEQTLLELGTLFEVVENFSHTSNKTNPEYQAMLQARWTELEAEVNERYDYEYQYYLQELSVP